MEIRRTEREMLPEIGRIYEACRQVMHSRGLQQWLNGYPAVSDIEADMAKGESYMLTDGDRAVGCAAILLNGEPTYAVIEGKWLTDGRYGTIHRVAVDPEYHSKGIGAEFIRGLAGIVEEAGLPSVRIDTHENNRPMRRTLLSLGFTECGIIHLADGAPRIAYERVFREPVIRPAARRDWEALREMLGEFYNSDAVLQPIKESCHQRNFEESLRPDGMLKTFIFEDNGQPVGFAELALNWSTEVGGRTVWIEDLYIREEYRGKGIGSAFFRRLKHDFDGTTLRYRLEVEDYNLGARRLYEREGFTVLPYMQMIRDNSELI